MAVDMAAWRERGRGRERVGSGRGVSVETWQTGRVVRLGLWVLLGQGTAVVLRPYPRDNASEVITIKHTITVRHS